MFLFEAFVGEVLMLKKSISLFLSLVIFSSFTLLWSNTQDSGNFLPFILENKEADENEKIGEEGESEEERENEDEKKDAKEDTDQADTKTSKEEKSEEEGEARIVEEKALEKDFIVPPTTQDDEEENDVSSILMLVNILKELHDANVLFENKTDKMAVYNDEKTENDVEVGVEVAENIESVDDYANNFIDDDNIGSAESFYDNASDNDVALNEEDFIIIDDFENEEIASEDNMVYDVDDDNFLTFDQEQEAERAKEESAIQNDFAKKEEEVSAKGELSSVVEEDDKVNISRYTNIVKGQSIDFSYPGEGWVYLGEETSQKGLDYTKRKMEGGKTFFTFRADVEGNYVLNFSYFDVFSGDFIVDAVSVKVMPNDDGLQKDNVVLEFEKAKKEKTEAEDQKKKIAEVPIDNDKVSIKVEDTPKQVADIAKEDGAKKDDEKTVIETPSTKEADVKQEKVKEKIKEKKEQKIIKKDDDSVKSIKKPDDKPSKYKEPEVFANVSSISPENAKPKYSEDDAKLMIDEAQDAISQGDAKVALERLNEFFEVASKDIDKAYLLRGRAYELNGEFKNIKLALKAYKFLTKTFPESPHRSVAMERIRYIERFFVNIK